MTYLRKQGGTCSPALNSIAQRILHWAESRHLVLAPQFIMGRNNVLADSLSRPNQIQGTEWTLKREVFLQLHKMWPVMIDLFATSSNHLCSLYFLPFHDPRAVGTDAFLQNWDRYQVYAFPSWSLIPLVLKKLRSSSGVFMTRIAPLWPQRPWCLSARSGSGQSCSATSVSRSAQTASLPLSSSWDPQAVASCVVTLQRFAEAQGFSSRVAKQIGLAF